METQNETFTYQDAHEPVHTRSAIKESLYSWKSSTAACFGARHLMPSYRNFLAAAKAYLILFSRHGIKQPFARVKLGPLITKFIPQSQPQVIILETKRSKKENNTYWSSLVFRQQQLRNMRSVRPSKALGDPFQTRLLGKKAWRMYRSPSRI